VKLLRFPIALVLALGLIGMLFLLLKSLISGHRDVEATTAVAKIEFTQLRRSGQVEEIHRAKPKVEKPEQVPSAPSLSVQKTAGSEARSEVAALAAPLGVGGGAGIGGILGVGGGLSGGGGVDRDSVPLVRIEPQYPAQAQQRRQEGWVQVHFTISGAGTVKNVRIVKSSDRIFEIPVLRAVEQWKYQPQMEGGKPVDRDGEALLRFDLKG
jgi:protein TonB